MNKSWTSPFVKLAALQSRVPSSNSGNANAVDFALSRVSIAERNLAEARDAARVAARQSGVPLANLFGKTQFVARSSGERWADEARAEGHAAGKQCAYEEVTRVFCNMRGVSYEAEMARAKIWSKICKKDSERTQAKMREAGFYRAVESGDLDRAGRILNELFPVEAQSGRRSAAETARAILAAGERARSDGSNERPDPEGLAKKIIDSGRRRRGEID
jgi:hypothetical protein